MPAIPDKDARGASTVVIERLGSKGDGQVRIDGDWVSVPRTLPGEEVRIAVNGDKAKLLEIVTPSPERQSPVCPHYASCGSCSLQHLADGPYRAFKQSLVINALKSRGLEQHVEEVWVTPPGTRRRISLAARRTKSGVQLGFHSRRSHDIVDINTCPVASPEITRKMWP